MSRDRTFKMKEIGEFMVANLLSLDIKQIGISERG